MSWSISKLYCSPKEAVDGAIKENLPHEIVNYIVTAAQEVERLNEHSPEQPMILVHGHGHLCHKGPGGGDYEVTTAKLIVTPLRFGQTLALPLAVV
jgi:hypothetical protein